MTEILKQKRKIFWRELFFGLLIVLVFLSWSVNRVWANNNKKNYYKRNVTAELSLTLTLYLEFLFKLIFHLSKLAQYLKFSTFCPLKQTWSKLGLWLYLLYLSKPAQYWEFDHICYPKQTCSELWHRLCLLSEQAWSTIRVWSHLPPQANFFKT